MLRQLSSSSGKLFSRNIHTVTMIKGHGIGPEISASVVEIFKAAKVPIDWEYVKIEPQFNSATGTPEIPPEAVVSINKNKVALKGPLETPVGKGHMSLNLLLRKTFDLYANVRPCISIPGYPTKFKNVNSVLIRENTEGEYSGIEHEVVPGVVQSIKLITRQASENVAVYAFEYAKKMGRPKVCVVHKANIMKLCDGLFLESCQHISKNYPSIQLEEMLIDRASLQIVSNPEYFSDRVMVMPNLYGDIISDLCAGLIGGLGLTPSGNIGTTASIFESVHGTAPDIASKNKANPTALLLSAVMMLRHMKLDIYADNVEQAVMSTIANKTYLTGDLGGKATTTEFTKAVIDHLK